MGGGLDFIFVHKCYNNVGYGEIVADLNPTLLYGIGERKKSKKGGFLEVGKFTLKDFLWVKWLILLGRR